jgi:hypothetical protein
MAKKSGGGSKVSRASGTGRYQTVKRGHTKPSTTIAESKPGGSKPGSKSK